MYKEVLLSAEMTEAAHTEELTPIVCGDVREESADISDPAIMPLPKEQINLTSEVFSPADEVWVDAATLIVEEGENVDFEV